MKLALMIFLILSNMAYASTELREKQWPFDGVTGQFDYESIQRGFKVYKEVCSACHSVKLLAFRHLEAIHFTTEQVKSLAGEYEVQDGPNDQGDMFKRNGRPSDQIPGPYANEKAARAANNGALPPDLSLIVKAREGGANYVFSILTGFTSPPPGFKLGDNMHYNKYFPGNQIAMPAPLIAEDQVKFDDGTKATIDQMAYDVVNFLQWAAEPEMQERKSIGIRVLIFVAILTIIMGFANKAIWSDLRRKK